MSDFGNVPAQRLYFGKGFRLGQRNERVFHPYTKIGFVCTDYNGNPLKPLVNEGKNNKKDSCPK